MLIKYILQKNYNNNKNKNDGLHFKFFNREHLIMNLG